MSVADPGFCRGGGSNPQGEGSNVLFGQKIPENCLKMKEFGPGGARAPGTPLDPPMHVFSSGMSAAPISDDKKKWVAWSPMRPFTLDDKKIDNVVVVKCEWALRFLTL